jgi:hypothetical protein
VTESVALVSMALVTRAALSYLEVDILREEAAVAEGLVLTLPACEHAWVQQSGGHGGGVGGLAGGLACGLSCGLC